MGRTALHYACKAGNMSTAQVLINDQNCEVDLVSTGGMTALMNAIESGNIELVVLCLNGKLNPFLKDALGRTAQDYAANFKEVQGQRNMTYDMRQLVDRAKQAWQQQHSEEELNQVLAE